jgi:hypothetical protein
MRPQLVIFVVLISFSVCIDEKELGFHKIGTFSKESYFLFIYQIFFFFNFLEGSNADGNEYQKSFYLSRDYKVNWIVARTVCISYGMDFARLETTAEFNAFKEMVKSHASLFEVNTHIDGITLQPGSKTEWYFSNGKKHPQPIQWNAGEPNTINNDRCMNIVKTANGIGYNDLPCSVNPAKDYENLKFVCQQYDY